MSYTKLTTERIVEICEERKMKYLSHSMRGTRKNITVQCSCGKIFTTRIDKIQSGHTKSCGCLQRPNLTGQIFGALRVIKEIQSARPGRWWLCKCLCGKEHKVQTNPLSRGAVRSCGCQHYSRGKYHQQWRGYEKISGAQWCTTRTSAAVRHIPFNITIEEAYEIYLRQHGKCALSGVSISLGHGKKFTASLDRIDSRREYSKENCQWVHKTVNRIKWQLSIEEFMRWIETIYRYRKNNEDFQHKFMENGKF